ncbi:MAG: hydrogenase [Planctomycetes bacterium]|nr:hydrogenase [Planctomycetota bacterium]
MESTVPTETPPAQSPADVSLRGDGRPTVPPLITGNKTPADVTRDVCAPLERGATGLWWGAFLAALALLIVGIISVGYQIATGIGTWGLNRTVGWAFDITNFVFWVGIGHAGTLISAVLLLFRQKWRTSINRSAEAMTIFAVICAGLFPVIHMGRPWLAFWVFPYPNDRGPLWVNFRSALLWDVFAIGTYFTISLLFWYIGMIPDLATIRDRATGFRKKIMGWLSLGWDGAARTWARYEVACVLLAALATPLVVSVHSVVSSDFATSIVPGWHTTVFPPYFVIGAIFSGFAMVLTLLLIARKVMNFEDYITRRHIQAMCKVIVFTGSIVGLAYLTELFVAWYSGNPYEQFAFLNRMSGPMAWSYWIMVSCNVLSPQLLWFRKVRESIGAVFCLSLVINVGMWFERFVIIVTSLTRDFLPSSWASYAPTWIEVGSLVGGFGLFFTLFLLFCRVLPMIAMFEVKAVIRPQTHESKEGGS